MFIIVADLLFSFFIYYNKSLILSAIHPEVYFFRDAVNVRLFQGNFKF